MRQTCKLQFAVNGKGRGTVLRFRVKTLGRFDSALVPTGPAGEAPDRWLLAIEEDLIAT